MVGSAGSTESTFLLDDLRLQVYLELLGFEDLELVADVRNVGRVDQHVVLVPELLDGLLDAVYRFDGFEGVVF
jgi:hypothetical protein